MSAKVNTLGDFSEMLGTPTVDSLTAWHFLSVLWNRATAIQTPVVSLAENPIGSAEPINYFRGYARSMIEQRRERAIAHNPYWVSTE